MFQTNRYLIYELLQKKIMIQDAGGNGKKARGVVERVYRDVLEGQIEFTIGGKRVSFTEPAAVVQEGKDIVFLYGTLGEIDDSDEALFEEARMAGHSGESVDEVMRRTAPKVRRETRFVLI